MSESDDDKINKLLKASPTLTPPESFYRGVLEKIEKKKMGTEEHPGAPWFWGIPAKALVSACVLMIIVLVARDKNKNEPEVLPPAVQKAEKDMLQSEARPALPSMQDNLKSLRKEKAGNFGSLAESREVQSRLNHSLVDYVGKPSPFPEEKGDLPTYQAPAASAGAGTAYVQQARDTNEGIASQASFQAQDKVYTKKTSTLDANYPVAAIALAGGGGASQAQEWKGVTSHIHTFRKVVMRSSADWQALWQAHAGTGQNAPPVNFQTSIVVGVFAGTTLPPGMDIEMTDMRSEPDKIVIVYRQIPVAPPSTGTTYPFHLWVIPQTNLTITFETEP